MMPKTRAWDKEEKRMWNVETIYIEDEYVKVNDGSIYGKTKKLIRNYELMRFADLTDELNNEIYEGDILKILVMSDFDKYVYGEVVYEYGVIGLKNVLYGWGYERGLIPLIEVGHRYEVVGNKYENPDLIGG